MVAVEAAAAAEVRAGSVETGLAEKAVVVLGTVRRGLSDRTRTGHPGAMAPAVALAAPSAACVAAEVVVTDLRLSLPMTLPSHLLGASECRLGPCSPAPLCSQPSHA